MAASGASGAAGIFGSLFGGAAKADAYKYQSLNGMAECRDCQAEPKVCFGHWRTAS